MSDASERIIPSCVEVLENYQQADMDGIMVIASRQAIHETIDAYWARVGTCEELTAERDALAAEVERLRGALTVYSDKVSEYAHEDPAISDLAYDWLNEDGGRQARAALKEGKD